MPEQVINFLCRYVERGSNRMTEPKLFGFGICKFRNLFVLHSFTTVTQHKEDSSGYIAFLNPRIIL